MKTANDSRACPPCTGSGNQGRACPPCTGSGNQGRACTAGSPLKTGATRREPTAGDIFWPVIYALGTACFVVTGYLAGVTLGWWR